MAIAFLDTWQDVVAASMFVVTATAPWIVVRRETQRITRRERLQCAVCGYDLRATPEKCPESGTVVKPGLPLLPPLETVVLTTDWPVAPIDPRPPGPDEDAVLLFDTDNGIQADLLAGQLRARGVEAKVHQSKPVTVAQGIGVRDVVFWKVMIWSTDIERAAAIVERFRPPRSAVLTRM